MAAIVGLPLLITFLATCKQQKASHGSANYTQHLVLEQKITLEVYRIQKYKFAKYTYPIYEDLDM